MAEEAKADEDKTRSELLKEFGFEEEKREMLVDYYGKTGFPVPVKAYRLLYEVHDLSLEEPYYCVLDALKEGFPTIDKLEDSFAAAENSSFFGVTSQRLGTNQDHVTQILVATGKLVKELFQIVREIRILKERLVYYNEADKEAQKNITKRGKGAEITLKGLFIDLVQGAAKNPGSVYGMARELEFVTLPDLFFDAPPFHDYEELERYITDLEKNFNRNLLRVLHRHLRQFLEWKKSTHREQKQREIFMLKYLQQHYEVIKMYLLWLKPYLKNVARLGMKEQSLSSPNLISAFEGSMLDIEFLASKEFKDINVGGEIKKGYDCVLATFNYRTRAEMKIVQEGYQRGPVHIGRMEFNLRVYHWTEDEIKKYKLLKEKETVLLLRNVSSSLEQAMDALGSELIKYLEEAKGEKKEEHEEKKEAAKKSFIEKYFADFYTPKAKSAEAPKAKKSSQGMPLSAFRGRKGSVALFQAWLVYNNVFKKSHKLITW